MTSKGLEALDRIANNFGECEVGSRYYDIEFNKDIQTIKQDLERKEQLEKENQELKKQLEIEKWNGIEFWEDFKKLKKAIEWLKENLNFKIEKHKSSPNCMFVSYKDLQEWLEPSNEIVDLLKEVLGE